MQSCLTSQLHRIENTRPVGLGLTPSRSRPPHTFELHPLDQSIYVTTANGKGSFIFEGVLPAGCPPDNCIGTLSAGTTTIEVQLDYQPSEPPNQPDDELELKDEQPVSHGGDAVRAVGFVTDVAGVPVVSGGSDGNLRYWKLDAVMEQVVDQPLPNIPYDLEVSDSGGPSIVATGEGGWNGHAGSETLRLWDASGFPLVQTQVPIGFVYCVAFSTLGWIAASDLPHGGSWSFSFAFAPDSTSETIELVSGTDGGQTKFWTIENVDEDPTVSVRSIDSGPVFALDWSQDGNRIVAGESGDITDGALKLWMYPAP